MNQINVSKASRKGDPRGMRWSQIKNIYSYLESIKTERYIDDKAVPVAKIMDDEREIKQ